MVKFCASDPELRVQFPLPAPLSKIVAPWRSIDKSTVKVDFFVAFILKKKGWCGMNLTLTGNKWGYVLETYLYQLV